MKFFFVCLYFSSLLSAGIIDNSKWLPFYGQNGEDKFIYEAFFSSKKEGVFIDIGANDGISFSNTYFFEKNLNWKGICFEPYPEKFKELRSNRKCICLEIAISHKEDVLDFLKIEGLPETAMLSGLLDSYDQRHLNRVDYEICRDQGIKEVIKVQAKRLDTCLKEYNIHHIDLLSIDTEGGELEILKSINLRKILVDVIIVENNFQDKEIENFLKSKKYVLVKTIDGNQIFRKRNNLRL